jgi:hypothetical protein
MHRVSRHAGRYNRELYAHRVFTNNKNLHYEKHFTRFYL